MVTVTDKSRAKLRTSQGDLVIEFLVDKAPRTVENFVGLANKGFYDGLTFHRVIKDFIVQGGCKNGDGTGKPEYTIRPEFNDTPHVKGTVSMARNNDPHSAYSQFFICHGEPRYLDSRYTAFARVVDGIEVLEKIATVPTDVEPRHGEKSIPRDPIYINGVDLTDVDFSEDEATDATTAEAEPAESKDDGDDAPRAEGGDDESSGEKKTRRGRRGGRGRKPKAAAEDGGGDSDGDGAKSDEKPAAKKSSRAPKAEKADKGEKADKAEKADKPAKAEKSDKADDGGDEKPKRKTTRRRRSAPKSKDADSGNEE
jgi:cyclophilin family peptidyl-prolyl cis-trans isomerase